MKRLDTFCVLLCAFCLSLALTPVADDLDRFIQEQMAQRQINGLSLAVIQDGKIQARAYGVTSRGGSAVTTDTLFQAGSISKSVAAMGAMKLVERGGLTLDDDVNGKLATWKVPENDFTKTQKVTLRRLLSHTAGLTVHGFPGYDVSERMPSVVEVLDGRGNTPAVRVDVIPGGISRYSGGGFTVAQLLVSDVSRKPFDQYMSETVLRPIGMTRSTFQQPLPPDRAAQTATGHSADRQAVAGKWHVYPELAAAGLWTTATDLAKFAIDLQQTLAGKSTTVVSRSTARQMVTMERNDYGLGLAITGSGASRTFGHNGRDAGFDALLLAFAEGDQGLVVMINANDNSGLMNRITTFVAKKYNWPTRPAPAPAASTRLKPTIPLEPVTGRYELSNNNMLTLTARGDSLFSDVNGLPDEEFAFIGDDRFGSTDRNVSFRITRNPDGEIVGLSWSVGGEGRPIPRIGPLFSSIRPTTDPAPGFTRAVTDAVRALAKGAAATDLPLLTAGARANFAGRPIPQLAGATTLTYLSAQDVTGRRIERYGGAVARILFYRVETTEGDRWLLIHVTNDNLITDYDVVDK